MKKFLFIMCLLISMAINCSATVSDAYQITYEDLDVTILFDDTTTYSIYQRHHVADYLVYGVDEDGISTCAWCWLTGHDIQNNAVTKIQHKVDVTVPRCLRTVYNVETCTKCDYINETELSTVYIDCCPED